MLQPLRASSFLLERRSPETATVIAMSSTVRKIAGLQESIDVDVFTHRLAGHPGRVSTEVVIRLKNQIVATGRFGGKVSKGHALTEFRRDKKRWTPGPAFFSAQALGLI
jgi:hypothetical protein